MHQNIGVFSENLTILVGPCRNEVEIPLFKTAGKSVREESNRGGGGGKKKLSHQQSIPGSITTGQYWL